MVEVSDQRGCGMAGIYRRGKGKTYWGRVQRAGVEQRRSLQTKDRATALRRLGEWVKGLDGIAWGDKPRRSFEETAGKFIAEHLTTLKPGGAKRYGVSLKKLAEHFGGKTLDMIGSAAMSEFETARRSEGVTPSTIRRDLACLSSMFASAAEWEWVDANPVPAFLKRRSKRGLKEGNKRTRYLTPDEEARLLEHATDGPREAMAMSIDTGLRQAEMFSLQWSQVDVAGGTITTTTMTKSGRARHVPLPERSRTILGTLPRHPSCPYVLWNPDTGTRYVHMIKGLKAAARRAGIKNLRWHDLRRTAGCRWLQRDRRSIEEVSVLLGHSSIKVTEDAYAFLEAEAVAKSVSGRTKAGTGTTDVL
jgi:integrase